MLLVEGQILVSMAVPLATAVGDSATKTVAIWQGSAAELVESLAPDGVSVVSAFQNVSAHRLAPTGFAGGMRRGGIRSESGARECHGALSVGGRAARGQRGTARQRPDRRVHDRAADWDEHPLQAARWHGDPIHGAPRLSPARSWTGSRVGWSAVFLCR